MSGIIEIKHLSKSFDSREGRVDALKDISLEIEKGDIYGIIGMSGAGKSTLVRCLNFLEKPTKGTVVVLGEDLSSLTPKELRKKRTRIAMIFQSFNLLMQRNVLDNVCFPMEIVGTPRHRAKKRAEELLEIVGLSDKEGAYPSQLSGGQQQRVAIARALATNPEILLCDEATSALDPTTTKSILALLREINSKYGITIVIITHSMSVVEEICTHVAIIDEGHLAEYGRVRDIFSHPSTPAGKRLVYNSGLGTGLMRGDRMIRIVFVENSSYEPVVANLVLEFKTPVNIMLADTKDVGGIATGEMILQLPEDNTVAERMITWLKDRKLEVEELGDGAAAGSKAGSAAGGSSAGSKAGSTAAGEERGEAR